MAIHHIHVQHGRTGLLDLGYFLAQTGKIRREDRWKDLNHLRTYSMLA